MSRRSSWYPRDTSRTTVQRPRQPHWLAALAIALLLAAGVVAGLMGAGGQSAALAKPAHSSAGAAAATVVNPPAVGSERTVHTLLVAAGSDHSNHLCWSGCQITLDSGPLTAVSVWQLDWTYHDAGSIRDNRDTLWNRYALDSVRVRYISGTGGYPVITFRYGPYSQAQKRTVQWTPSNRSNYFPSEDVLPARLRGVAFVDPMLEMRVDLADSTGHFGHWGPNRIPV